MIGSLADYLDNNEKGVTDFTRDGKCIGCGACCSNVLPLSNNEIRIIKSYIKRHDIKEQKNVLINALDMTCPFMDKGNTDKKCLIYDVRPEICREFNCSEPYGTLSSEALWQLRLKNTNMRQMFYGC